jgi:hypothetical protein
MLATTVPEPTWPALGAYPASTRTTTSAGVSPAIAAPDLVIELDATTARYAGSDAGGPELEPGADDHVPEHAVTRLGLSAKPLKAAGAPATVFVFAH